MMNFDGEYLGEVKSESRKMRTTRGPGFTTLTQSYKLTMAEPVAARGFAIESKLNCKDAWPDDLKHFFANSVEFTSYTAAFEPTVVVSLRVTYEDTGHWRRAEVGRKTLSQLRFSGADLRYIVKTAAEELERIKQQEAIKEASTKLRWVASGIAAEADRLARAEISYQEKLDSLRRTLKNYTENHAMDAVATISREHGFDEAELRAAVEKVLAQPTFTLLGA